MNAPPTIDEFNALPLALREAHGRLATALASYGHIAVHNATAPGHTYRPAASLYCDAVKSIWYVHPRLPRIVFTNLRTSDVERVKAAHATSLAGDLRSHDEITSCDYITGIRVPTPGLIEVTVRA